MMGSIPVDAAFVMLCPQRHMQYFLTGATGLVGGRIARQLLGAGHQVRALVRAPSKAQHLAALGVELHAGDITIKESLRTPMTGVDGVFHVAAWYRLGARDHNMAERINVEAALVRFLQRKLPPRLRLSPRVMRSLAGLMAFVGKGIPLSSRTRLKVCA